MKTRLSGILLAVMLAVPAMTGCQATQKVNAAGRSAVQGAQTTTTVIGKAASPALSLEDAQKIALEHAGFSAEQVTALRTEYEVEHGIPQYDVEFHHGVWEYDYEIHGDTGEILCYSKDD